MSEQTPNTETMNDRDYPEALYEIITKSRDDEFNGTLKALREAKDWEVRQAAAIWLANEAEKNKENDKWIDDALYHLTKSTSDESFHVRRTVWETSKIIWNAGWEIEKNKVFVLNRVEKVLLKDEQHHEFKKAAADWLKTKAEDIVKDNRMMGDIVDSLLERAKRDERFDVRRSAVEAAKVIWDKGWVTKSTDQVDSNTEEEHSARRQVFRQVVGALQIEECWEVRAAAALWLGEKAQSITDPDNIRLMTDSVNALTKLAKKDNERLVRITAVEACREIWDAGWESGDQKSNGNENKSKEQGEIEKTDDSSPREANNTGTQATALQVIVLDLVLNALEIEDADEDKWEIRRTAADWLGGKTKEIGAFRNQLYMGISDALTLIQITPSEPEESIRSANAAQKALWASLKNHWYQPLTEEVQKGRKSGQDKDLGQELTDEIKELSTYNYLGSREALTFLVGCWVNWICDDQNPQLVEYTAESIRYNRYAVLALIEHLGKQTCKGEDSDKKSLQVDRRITKQLAEMSNPAFFEEEDSGKEKNIRTYEHGHILRELKMHAVPVMLRRLPEEKDDDIRKNIVRMLGYTGDREAVDALSRQVASNERERKNRQGLLSEYYLEPSKKRNEQTSMILERSIKDAKRNLGIIQLLNISVFIVGLVVVAGGIFIGIQGDAAASRVAGALAAIGGLAGVISLLIRDPLDRIQNALAKLVQMETAFTTFIWELNLNGTYIQSSYIEDGELNDAEIQETVNLVEKSADLTMNMIHKYAELRTDPNIQRLKPEEGFAGSEIILIGKHLLGERIQADSSAEVYIDHGPNPGVTVLSWTDKQVLLELPSVISQGTIYISLFIDGKESNALPFRVW